MTDRVAVAVIYAPPEVLFGADPRAEMIRAQIKQMLREISDGDAHGIVLPHDLDEQGRQRWELRFVPIDDVADEGLSDYLLRRAERCDHYAEMVTGIQRIGQERDAAGRTTGERQFDADEVIARYRARSGALRLAAEAFA